MTQRNKETLLYKLESEVLSLLRRKDLTTSDRIKAVDSGTRLALIRHRVDPGEREGSFFNDPPVMPPRVSNYSNKAGKNGN